VLWTCRNPHKKKEERLVSFESVLHRYAKLIAMQWRIGGIVPVVRVQRVVPPRIRRAIPWNWFVPDFVNTLMMPAANRHTPRCSCRLHAELFKPRLDSAFALPVLRKPAMFGPPSRK